MIGKFVFFADSVISRKMSSITIKEVTSLNIDFNKFFGTLGMECRPLKIGWYNDLVADAYNLPYEYDILAFLVMSQPSMFEKSFLPYMLVKYEEDNTLSQVTDPIDESVKHAFSNFEINFSKINFDFLFDYDVTPSKLPKILVQTAGHVSGATRYYQRIDLPINTWDPDKKIYGVCLHPYYGGWFAFRGVAILKDVLCQTLPKIEPE